MTFQSIAPDIAPSELINQGQWSNLPPELLLDIIRRVEETETSWPATTTVVVYCASVCKSWRDITKNFVKIPEKCERLTFPISLKQPGPQDSPIQCYIKRDKATSTYRLYLGLTPSEVKSEKLLLAAKKIRRVPTTEFAIYLVADNFSRASSTYVGKLRSNILGSKYTIYNSQPPSDNTSTQTYDHNQFFVHKKQVSPNELPACGYFVDTISYKLDFLRANGPRRMNCTMHSIPISSIAPNSVDSLMLKNKAPKWHEQLQCWCLNFKGRAIVASAKNFQLLAAVDPSNNAEQEKVILQFGKTENDIFTMDYQYPLSAYQAFAICLSSFDTKAACLRWFL